MAAASISWTTPTPHWLISLPVMVVKVPSLLVTKLVSSRGKDAAWADLVVVPRILTVEHRVTERVTNAHADQP